MLRPPVTVLTPVYFNVPERWTYFVATVSSFYKCSQYSGPLIHKLIDDRSPLCQSELREFCGKYGFELLGRMEEENRRGFSDVFRRLIDSVETEYFIYLEPDHYFYLPYDFISPAIQAFSYIKGLHQLFFRAPLEYTRFTQEEEGLQTHDNTFLERMVLDEENTAWYGVGKNHETFSLMPSLFRKDIMESYLVDDFVSSTPRDLELEVASRWDSNKTVAYLNGQAFCYHIGGAGKQGPGGFLQIGDKVYEETWSKKIL